MTTALTDLRTVLAGGVLASVLLVSAVAISPFGLAFGSGTSMQPALCDGSVLVVDETEHAERGDVVVVEQLTGGRVIHRVAAATDEHVVTWGDNRAEPDVVRAYAVREDGSREQVSTQVPDREDVRGVVVAVLSDGCES
jgi:signal peptidase I